MRRRNHRRLFDIDRLGSCCAGRHLAPDVEAGKVGCRSSGSPAQPAAHGGSIRAQLGKHGIDHGVDPLGLAAQKWHQLALARVSVAACSLAAASRSPIRIAKETRNDCRKDRVRDVP
jgi:hypothetical protein